MDNTIRVGDLVMVVRGHACDLGTVFTVLSIDHSRFGWLCVKCWEASYESMDVAVRTVEINPDMYPLSWLKRIPPLSETDHVETRKEIHA